MSPADAAAYYLALGRRHEDVILSLLQELGGDQEFVYIEAVAARFSRRGNWPGERPAPVNHLRRGVIYLLGELGRSGLLEVRQDPGTDFVTRRSVRLSEWARRQPLTGPPVPYLRSRLSPLAMRSRFSPLESSSMA